MKQPPLNEVKNPWVRKPATLVLFIGVVFVSIVIAILEGISAMSKSLVNGVDDSVKFLADCWLGPDKER